MANLTRWVGGAGQGLTWGSAGFTAADFNSLASGSTVLSTTAISNGTALDLYADVSGTLTVGGTTTASSFLTLYLLPLNQDGSTYGDGSAGGSTPPAAGYIVGSVGVKSGVTSGSAVTFAFRGILLPPGSFKLVLANNLTVSLNASAAATVSYRTYNENLNA